MELDEETIKRIKRVRDKPAHLRTNEDMAYYQIYLESINRFSKKVYDKIQEINRNKNG
jgi:hypothetical protein